MIEIKLKPIEKPSTHVGPGYLILEKATGVLYYVTENDESTICLQEGALGMYLSAEWKTSQELIRHVAENPIAYKRFSHEEFKITIVY